MSIILIVLLVSSVYSQEVKQEKEPPEGSFLCTRTLTITGGSALYFDGTDSYWKRFTDELVEVKLGEWQPMWPGVELAEDGLAVTEDKDYTYIEKTNTDISSYYNKRSKILQISVGAYVYMYLWEEKLENFRFIGWRK